MTARERHSRPPRRAAGTRQPRTTIRLYLEGTSTEPEYIDGLKRLPELDDRVAIAFVIEQTGAVPLTLVQAAIADKQADKLDIDHFWCVFDVETPPHPNLQQALTLAEQHGIEVAVSNPCFELWLVLHHQDQTGYLSTKETIRLRSQLDPGTGKHLDRDRYMPQRLAAVARARALATRHEENGTRFPDDNPSSTMWRLVQTIEGEAAHHRTNPGAG